MRILGCYAFLGVVLVLHAETHGAALTATNIMGTDGTTSMLNDGQPELPLVIGNISGLALTDPVSPGDNLVIGGWNNSPDVRVTDTYFQAGAVAGPEHGTTSPPASNESSVLLLEAAIGGQVGIDTISWTVTAYKSYDGTGPPLSDVSTVFQTASGFTIHDVTLNVTGQVVAGDKFVVHNSGSTAWTVGAFVDIDGDGVSTLALNVEAEDFTAVIGGDTNNSQDFNGATVTIFGWEIKDGEFAEGRFDITFDTVTTANTWPGGDRFDVVPEPATLSLLALGGMALIRRRNRKGEKR